MPTLFLEVTYAEGTLCFAAVLILKMSVCFLKKIIITVVETTAEKCKISSWVIQ